MAGDRVLVVDDEPSLRFVLSSLLKSMGCEVVCAESGEAALLELERGGFELALLDIVLPGIDGLDVLRIVRERSPDTEVVMMTSHASLETAIGAIRSGAYDYLHKPFELDEASATVRRALEKCRLLRDTRELMAARERQNRDLQAVVRRLRALNAAGVGISSVSSEREVIDLFVEIVVAELDAENVSVTLGDVAGAAGGVPAAADAVPGRLSVAIKSLGQVLGVVDVTGRHPGRTFGHDEASFLEGLCGQLAVAIERARQTERLQDSIGLLKTAHDRLLASERLNALGEMAAGVAHDFNNILNGILGRSQLLQVALRDASPNPDRLHASVEMIETLVHQGADAVRRIQDTARIRKERADDDVDPNAVVRLTHEIMLPHLDGGRGADHGPIEVRCDLEALEHTTGSTLELVQALSNITFNAIDAMPSGGTLTYRTGSEGGWIRIEIEDTGVGMSAEVRSKLFVPFHSSKPEGHGLGLSIVYGIVSRMGGRIEVESEPGAGSRFTLHLPVRSSEAASTPASSAGAAAPHRRARVLVIEDEPYNREFYVEGLGIDGHDVTAVGDGTAGLAVFDAGTFDLVLTDLSMPGMSGWDVAAAVKQRRPDVPVLMLSGWGEQLDEAQVHEAGVDCLLSKPPTSTSCWPRCARCCTPVPRRPPHAGPRPDAMRTRRPPGCARHACMTRVRAGRLMLSHPRPEGRMTRRFR